jgi:hypothetical protein
MGCHNPAFFTQPPSHAKCKETAAPNAHWRSLPIITPPCDKRSWRAGVAGVVHFWNRVQQHLGLGVLRVAKQRVFVGQLHQSAADHDTHQVQWAQCINAVR